jgi:predicted PurR-regulated permease PerM
VQIGQWIGILALAIALYILWEIRNVLMLIFAAVVLATALNTLGILIQKRCKVKRSTSLLAAILFILSLLGLSLWLVVPAFSSQFQELTQLVPQGVERFNLWFENLANYAPPFLVPYLPDIDDIVTQLQPLANRLIGGSFTFVSGTLGGVLNVLLVVILTLMMLAEPEAYSQAFVRCFPSFYRRRINEILVKCGEALRGWLLGILFNMCVIGGFSGLGLLILGVKLPLANGIFAGLLTFIPNIGPALSVVPPMAIALLDAPWKAGAVFILYFLVQQLETNVLTPYVMAQQVSLLPAVTLLSQVFFATFFGFLGLLLALPLTVVGQVWLQEIVIKDIFDRWTDEEHPPHLDGSDVVESPIAPEVVMLPHQPLPQVVPNSPTDQPANNPSTNNPSTNNPSTNNPPE